jgi:hypothetical protein
MLPGRLNNLPFPERGPGAVVGGVLGFVAGVFLAGIAIMIAHYVNEIRINVFRRSSA